MTVRGRTPVGPLASSSNHNPSRAPIDDVLGMAALSSGAVPSSFNSGAAIRDTLHAIASESGSSEGPNRVKLLRPLVAQAHDVLRERLELGGSGEDYLRGRARLADSVVVGLLRIASISSETSDGSMVAPLAAIAVGGYGRSELAPGSDLDVLFLLPESSRSRHAGGVAPATRACIGAVVACLWDLGFAVDHAARSAEECLELAKDDPTVLAGLVDRRYLWGRPSLFATLDTDFTALFAGPDAECWREAVGSALAVTRRHAARSAEALAAEPDLKRDPGGLRDLQCAFWANMRAAGGSISPTPSSLVEAQHFLWLVRCHLHFLAGRAEDRLSLSLQPAIARRLGLGDANESVASPLLDLFRYHARNVVAAIESAPRSPATLPNDR